MEEIRFLNISKEKTLPTFVRMNAETRLDAIEAFAAQHGLTIRRLTDETVTFLRRGQKIFYSVSGCDPWLKLMFG